MCARSNKYLIGTYCLFSRVLSATLEEIFCRIPTAASQRPSRVKSEYLCNSAQQNHPVLRDTFCLQVPLTRRTIITIKTTVEVLRNTDIVSGIFEFLTKVTIDAMFWNYHPVTVMCF